MISEMTTLTAGLSFGGMLLGPPSFCNGTICTGPAKLIQDGRKAFPSGHASLSFASLLYTSLYLSAVLKIYNRPEWRPTSLLSVALTLAPVVLAAFIALSRVIDFRHSAYDIFWGSFLGSVIAWWSYRHYFAGLMVSGDPAFRNRIDYLLAGAVKENLAPMASEANIETGQVVPNGLTAITVEGSQV
jgi:membrane-associated phospholipid phosphatase